MSGSSIRVHPTIGLCQLQTALRTGSKCCRCCCGCFFNSTGMMILVTSQCCAAGKGLLAIGKGTFVRSFS